MRQLVGSIVGNVSAELAQIFTLGSDAWAAQARGRARTETSRRVSFLEEADSWGREEVGIAGSTLLAWRRAARRWAELGGSTRAAANKRAGRHRRMLAMEERDRRASVGGARTYVSNGVVRVEGVSAQRKREASAARGRERRAWLLRRRALQEEHRRGCEASKEAAKTARRKRNEAWLCEVAANVRVDRVLGNAPISEREEMAVIRRAEESARAEYIASAEARWALPMPRAPRASARALELVRRARVPCTAWHSRMIREMGGVRKWPKVACWIAARTESTHS